jgi:F0F1-type ATP synthase assembly protein I
VTNQSDDRSLLARAYQWATNVTAIAIEMVAPILIGAWIDGRMGTKGVFSIIGGIIGVTGGVWALLRMVEPLRRKHHPTPDHHEPPHERHL